MSIYELKLKLNMTKRISNSGIDELKFNLTEVSNKRFRKRA